LETSTQPQLFILETADTVAAVELFPMVWQAAENLVNRSTEKRHAALDELLRLGAPRISPLVAYLVAARLGDTDISLRVRVVEVLANILRPDESGNSAPEKVREYIISYLLSFESGDIIDLLEVGILDDSVKGHIARLLNFCPNAGKYLSQVFEERTLPVEIRRLAVDFIGQIGFVEALPVLERIFRRLQSSQKGQKSMPFAPGPFGDERQMLPEIRVAIALLKTS
jgi:hypothetical protein